MYGLIKILLLLCNHNYIYHIYLKHYHQSCFRSEDSLLFNFHSIFGKNNLLGQRHCWKLKPKQPFFIEPPLTLIMDNVNVVQNTASLSKFTLLRMVTP